MLAALTNVNKFYNGNQVLKNVNLTIEDNDRIGLIGINGCGKTTLLRILTGKEQPDRFTDEDGIITISSKVTIGYLEQTSALDNDKTVIDEMKNVFSELLDIQDKMRQLEQEISKNSSRDITTLTEEYSRLTTIFEAKDGYLIDVKIKTVLGGMGFDESQFNRVISGFSGGEKTRLAISKLLLEEPNLLILDEPTNHLDFKTVLWLEDYLKSYKGALLIVSHDRYFLDSLVQSIYEIERGVLTRYKGNYTAFTKLKEEAVARQQKEYEKQQKQIAKLEDYVARNIARASTSKSAQSRVKALEKMEVIEKPVTPAKAPKIALEYDISPPFDLLTVDNIDISVGDNSSRKILAENISFEIKRGEKVAIIGDNGAGKSTLLKILQGKLPHKGKIRWASNVKISYFEQENTILNPCNTVFNELHNKYPSLTDFEIRSLLGKVRLVGENVFKQIGVISGGEQAKVRFAVMMLERSNVLILDEPTNHLDLMTKEVLEQALVDYEGTIIFVSHDRYLLNKLATRIIEINSDNVENYNGNFNFYLKTKREYEMEAQKLEEYQKQELAKQEAKAKGIKAYRTREQRSLEVQRRNKIKALERELDDFQAKLDKLQEEITKEEIYSNFKLMHEKCLEIENIKNLMDKKLEELIELEEH
ncbi:MAG: ATP-binding cassette domain-containing protein [Clostridiales bacterium]|jgi:ATP-binding cassette subfamily F protein 3|nr:ATP-binding cassette domain-containing protein [Clostridiales bacterium]